MDYESLKKFFTDKSNIKWFVLVTAVCIILVALRNFIGALLLILATITVSFLARFHKIKNFGFELVTFTTVLIGVTHGIIAGLITGMLLYTIHTFISTRFGMYLLWVIPSFGIAGVLAAVFSSASLFWLGIGLTLFLHLSFLLTRSNKAHYLPYLFINVLINAGLFLYVAPKIVSFI